MTPPVVRVTACAPGQHGWNCWHHTPGKPTRKGDCKKAPDVQLQWGEPRSGVDYTHRYFTCYEHLAESIATALEGLR